MFTLLLARMHIRSTKASFQPHAMYFGMFLLDYASVMAVIAGFANLIPS